MDKICSVEWCEAMSTHVGMCKRHYLQMYRHGKIFKRTMYDKNEFVNCGDHYKIILYKKEEEIARALIDKDDYEKCKNKKWSLNDQGYVLTGRLRLHRFILGLPKKHKQVDHINRIKTDNRKKNLRIISQTKNMVNGKLRKDNFSGYPGVYLKKDGRKKKWSAQVKIKGKKVYVENFYHKTEAIKARKTAELKYFGFNRHPD